MQEVTEEHVRQVILSIDGCKSTSVADIYGDMLQFTLVIHLSVITKIINLLFENGCFPDNLKLVKVIPIVKKNDDLDKQIYSPVCVFLNKSKIFERIVYSKIDTFGQDKLSNLLICFRKSHSTQHCLMYMLEIWKISWVKDDIYVLC